MWIIEDAPSGSPFWPINIDKLSYISDGKDDRQYYIKFHLDEDKRVMWMFEKEKDRNEYLNKIRQKLPKLDLGIDTVSL